MTERPASGTLLSRRFRLVLLHLAEEARRDLDGSKSLSTRSIHSLRIRMKNLRAILMLVKQRVPEDVRKAINALAGSLKDIFSEQRDAYVVAQLRTKLDRRHGATPEGAKESETVAKNDSAKLQIGRLIRVVSKVELKRLSWEEVFEEYVKRYRDARRAMRKCLQQPSSEAFHKWRRPVKDLFYQSQVLQPIDGMKARRLRADRLGDRLGTLNDLQMLHAEVTKSRGSGLAKRIARKQKAAKTEIFKVARKLFAERPRDIARELERCVKFHPAIAAQAVRQT